MQQHCCSREQFNAIMAALIDLDWVEQRGDLYYPGVIALAVTSGSLW